MKQLIPMDDYGVFADSNDTVRANTTISLPMELKDQLQKEADEKGYSLRDLIVFILWDYVHSSIAPK